MVIITPADWLNMDIRQLNTFRLVAEQLNFTRAAELLHLAQSSVSAHIRGLERELGVMLFDRMGKQVHLTDAGEKLYSYACKIDDMTDEIRSVVAGEQYIQGSLTIRMPETLANVYMPEVIEQYNKRYPGVRLNFINCSDKELARELSTGRIDIALLMTDDLTMKDVNIKYLKTEPLVMCSSPEHPLAVRKCIHPTDLGNQLLLLPKTDWSYRRMFERSLDEAGVTFRTIEFSSGYSLQRCLQRGIGVTICPEISVSRELREGSLKLLGTKEIVSETPVVMIWHIDKWCSALLQLFIDLTKKIIR